MSFMGNYITSNTPQKSGGNVFNWLKKNISVANINKLGNSIKNIGAGITDAITSGKNAISRTAKDVGAAAGAGFFQENKWWIIGGAGVLALILVFSMSRRK